MKNILKNTTTPDIPLAVLLILLCVGNWFMASVNEVFRFGVESSNYISTQVNTFFLPFSLLSNLSALVMTLFNAFLVSQINTRFSVIRNRTFLPVFLFLLLMSSWGSTHTLNVSHFLLMLFILMLFNFFSTTRNRNASEQTFLGTLLLSVSGLLVEPFLFLIPVSWIGLAIFQSLSVRTFLASVFGALAPWLVYVLVQLLVFKQVNLSHVLDFRPSIHMISLEKDFPGLIYMGFLIVMMIIGLFWVKSLSFSEAIHTRNKLNFLILMLVAVVLLAFIYQNQFSAFSPVIALLGALLISHPFTLKQGRFAEITYTVFLVVNILYVVSRYIFH